MSDTFRGITFLQTYSYASGLRIMEMFKSDSVGFGGGGLVVRYQRFHSPADYEAYYGSMGCA